MSFDLEHRLRVFLASAPQKPHIWQVVEFSHSALTATRWFWRETIPGFVRSSDDRVLPVEPLNMQIVTPGGEGDLDQVLEIRIDTTDVSDEFRRELRRIPLDTTEKIAIVYREYLSDDPDSPLVESILYAESVSYQKGAATVQAVSPRLSMLRTGELYTVRDIPMKRGFL